MDEIATRAIIIGISIFITLIIVTVVIFEFSQIQKVYKVTAETDVTFEERLNEFDKYKDSNNDFRGLDVKNTISKYEYDDSVEVCVQEAALKCSDIIIEESDYNKKYSASLEEMNNINRIIFRER